MSDIQRLELAILGMALRGDLDFGTLGKAHMEALGPGPGDVIRRLSTGGTTADDVRLSSPDLFASAIGLSGGLETSEKLVEMWHRHVSAAKAQELVREAAPLLRSGRMTIADLSRNLAVYEPAKPDSWRSASSIASAEGHRDHCQLLTTGIRDLDGATGGGVPVGDLTGVVALPGYGKTALLLSMMSAWGEYGQPSLLLSLEMSDRAATDRVVAQMTGESLRRIANMGEQRWSSLVSRAGGLESLSLSWVADPQWPVLESIARSWLAVNSGPILVDYLQLIRWDALNANEETSLRAISNAAATLAREFRVPVVMAAQMAPETPSDRGPAPSLHSVSNCRGFARPVALMIMFDRRPYESVQRNRHSWSRRHLRVTKNRYGKSGEETPLAFCETTTRFHSLDASPLGVENES